MFRSRVGETVTLYVSEMRVEYRVDAVDAMGRTIQASVKNTNPELIAAIGEWDSIRNIDRMKQIDQELWRQSNQCKVCMAEPDENGVIEHGRGCFVECEDGGGSSYVEPLD